MAAGWTKSSQAGWRGRFTRASPHSTRRDGASMIAHQSTRRPANRPWRKMRKAVRYASKVEAGHRAKLERLLFFNGCQDRVAHGIVDAIDKYGPPEIHGDSGWLRVKVAGLPDVQSLFALDDATGELLGVAMYTRPDLEHISVLHIGLDEQYCAGGDRGSMNLLLRLMQEIRRSSKRVKGVRRLSVHYGTQRVRAQA
jgi:hypothetical protein